VARTEAKRCSDHAGAAGCRPALNVDVLRTIGVCKTPAALAALAALAAALAALGARFGGCGRVKNGFALGDAAFMFHLVADFGCTYAQLAPEVRVSVSVRVKGLGSWKPEIRNIHTLCTLHSGQ
jgi:hypothetical protein